MRIVVDIVEGAYTACKAVKDVEDDGRNPLLSYLINAVANGTPLDDTDTNVGEIYECTCGYGWYKNKVSRFHFCPNCGAKMVESQESEDKG